MKVTTDACLFGAWCASEIQHLQCSTILDIGAGTGLLSLMIAQKNNININAVEIDEHAAKQALDNISNSPWKDRISLHFTDILKHVGNYECIVCNPPFYENELQSPHSRNNLAHHSTGLTLADLIQYAKTNLTNNSFMFLLLPFKRIDEAEKMLNSKNFFIHKKLLVQQSTRHSPFRAMLMMGKEKIDLPTTEIISIKDGNDYTEDFKALLKDYYLYL